MRLINKIKSMLGADSNQNQKAGFVFDPGKDYFKAHNAVFTERVRKDAEVPIEWELIDGVDASDLIDGWRAGCRCTARVTWEGNKVKAVFTNQETNIPKDGVTVVKSLWIYFRDGKGKIPNGRGGMRWPKSKANAKLTFSGTVIP